MSGLLVSFRLVLQAARWRTVAVLVILALSAVTTVGVALSMRWVVNNAGAGRLPVVVLAALVAAGAYALSSSGRLVADSVLRIEVSDRAELQLQREIQVAATSLETIEHFERPAYLDRLLVLQRSCGTIVSSCWAVAELLSVAVGLVLSLVLLIGVHPLLGLLVLLAVPSLLLAERGTGWIRRSLEGTAEHERAERHLHELLTTSGPAREVLIAGSAGWLDQVAHRRWSAFTRSRSRAQLSAAAMELLGWALFAAGYLAALAFVAELVLEGRRGVGDVVLVIGLVSGLRQQVADSIGGVARTATGLKAMDDLRWLRSYAAEHRSAPGRRPPDRLSRGITLRGIGFRYPGSEEDRLREVDLNFPAGSTVALVGVNGAGKTTLVKLLSGFYRPTSGSIEVDGQPLAGIDLAGWQSRVTAAYQDFARFELRARETVGVGDLPRVEDRPAVDEALRRAEAAELVAALPEQGETPLGVTFGGAQLSTGQWQRLALARACMRRTPLLMVLDEPTASLDPRAEHLMYEHYQRVSRQLGQDAGTVTVFVTHRFSTVSMADLIVVLDAGRVVQQGTHQELLAAGGAYAELFRAQADAYA